MPKKPKSQKIRLQDMKISFHNPAGEQTSRTTIFKNRHPAELDLIEQKLRLGMHNLPQVQARVIRWPAGKYRNPRVSNNDWKGLFRAKKKGK